MSPPSPSRAKRRRTTMTAGSQSGDTAAGAPYGDQYVDATPIMSTEPVKRKRLDTNVAHQQQQQQQQQQQHVQTAVTPAQVIPTTQQYQLQQPQPQPQPASPMATTPRPQAQHHHHQQQQRQQQVQQMIGLMPVFHRPTYRSDLAKHGYLVRNSLGCGSYSKVNNSG